MSVRERLNNNPLVQAIGVGALAVLVVFMLLTRVTGSAETTSSDSSTSGAASTTSLSPTPASPSSSESTLGASPDVAPGAAPPAVAGITTDFKAGPGLPKAVADAYADGKVVVLLVIREHPQGCYSDFVGGQCAGLDDRRLKAIVELLTQRPDTTVFVTHAAGIGRYSRIAQGVDVDRVPALIVIRPKSLTKGPLPEAAVSYGFRGPGSVAQTVRDALYKGRDDLPYYPN